MSITAAIICAVVYAVINWLDPYTLSWQCLNLSLIHISSCMVMPLSAAMNTFSQSSAFSDRSAFSRSSSSLCRASAS